MANRKIRCKLHLEFKSLKLCKPCYKKEWYFLNKNRKIVCRNCKKNTQSGNGNLCASCHSDNIKSKYLKNKTKCIKYAISWQKNNPSKNNAIKSNYRKNNRKKIALYNVNYNKKNPNYRKNYDKRRRKTDLFFKLKQDLKSSIRKSLKKLKIKKDKKSILILGCTVDFARIYLESLFQPGMTWENHGKWHIDHMVPLASARTKEDVYKLCHYTNLQPLWAKDNSIKIDKMPDGTLARKLKK